MFNNKLNKHICFINPTLGLTNYKRVDLLRSYLPLGCLTSSLINPSFLFQFASKNNIELEKNISGFDISVIQLSLKGSMSITDYLKDYFYRSNTDPMMICMTATSAQLEEAVEVASVVKKIRPESFRIIGGPHVSVLPEKTLQGSEFQVACVGEGVETITELALKIGSGKGMKSLQEISGIVYKDNSSIHRNDKRNYLFSLNDYPYPSNSLDAFVDDLDDDSENARDIVYILGGFGCSFNCSFCAQKAIHSGKIRERSAKNIIGEIKGLKEKGFNKFAIVQETFTSNKKRIREFCSILNRNSLDIEWTAESRIDQLSFRQLKEMKKSGLRLIQLGLETGDQKLLSSVSKKSSIDDAAHLIEHLNRLRINTSLYLMVGLPQQDWQSILKTTLFFIGNIPYNTATMHASTSIAIPYPGTEIYEKKMVRMLNGKSEKEINRNWQVRNPKISVNDNGEFIGNNLTETDAMTSREILESLICLEDICFSILHLKFNKSLNIERRRRFSEYADKLIYMIERRTIRDLIIFSQDNMTIEKKKKCIDELDVHDKGKEKHFRDILLHYKESPSVFRDFLSQISFLNGFHILKRLSVPNRIKWMKFCCLVWNSRSSNFHKFSFSGRNNCFGTMLDKKLSEIRDEWIDEAIKNNTDPTVSVTGINKKDLYKKMGITLHFHNDICELKYN